MDLRNKNTEYLEATIRIALEADLKAGLGVDFYEYLLRDLLDSYQIVGEFEFVRFESDKATVLYLDNKRWYMHYDDDHENAIAYIVRHIEKLDQLEFQTPLGDSVICSIYGTKLFNLEDLKMCPLNWREMY